MDRQDTQNLLSDGEFESLQHNLRDLYAVIPNNPSLFDSTDAGSNCRTIENNQPLQQNQQLYLHQQHQGNFHDVAQPPMSNVKIELQPTIGTATAGDLNYFQHSYGIPANSFMQSDSRYSSTPPELMRGVQLSEVQGNRQPQTGHCMVRAQNQLEMVTMPVPPVINNGYSQHQQQITYCDNQMQDNIPLENENVCQVVANIKKSPDIVYSIPFSPGTIIATEIIDTDCKNEEKYTAHAGSAANDEAIYHVINKSISENLPHSPSIDFSNLKNWKGDFNYDITVAAGQLKKNKVCYSKKLDRVYCNPYIDFELHVVVNDWQAMTMHDAEVRVIAVYADPENRTRPVNRCFQCLKNDNVSAEKAKAHLVQLSNAGSRYTTEGSRDAVYLPLVRSHAGADHVTMLVRCACVTSCVGGPNRRAFSLVFSLMMGGVERGRRVLPLKCCKGVLRDMKKDEEDETDAKPAIPADTTSRSSGTVNSGSHGALINIFSSPKRVSSTKTGTSKAVSKRKTSKNMVTSSNDHSTILTSSDSDSDVNVTVKKQRGTSPLSYAMPANNTNIPAGYVCAVFPEQFQDDVKDCLEKLISLDHVKKTSPDILQQMKL